MMRRSEREEAGGGGSGDAFKTRTHTSESGGKNAGPAMQNLGYLRDVAELRFKVYLSMEAESAIGVSNS